VREWDLDVREAAAGLGFVERRQRKVFRERNMDLSWYNYLYYLWYD
jgi:hypothetical protein